MNSTCGVETRQSAALTGLGRVGVHHAPLYRVYLEHCPYKVITVFCVYSFIFQINSTNTVGQVDFFTVHCQKLFSQNSLCICSTHHENMPI